MVGAAIAVMFSLLAGCNAQRWANEAAETTYQETRPLALLNKYRKFKEMAATLDSKQATILAYEARVKKVTQRYGEDATKWPRDVRESLDDKETEVDAVKGSYNLLAAEYNTAMADYTTKFCNVGQMPQGFPDDCQTALKKSYATYIVD
jgi:hypothetical protein